MRNLDKIPDYLRDKKASTQMAKKIEDSWIKNGYKDTRVWVEEEWLKGSEKPLYVIRGNIIQQVPSISSL